MSSTIFIQDSRIGQRVFHLKGDSLEINGKQFGEEVKLELPIRRISGDYTRGTRRFPLLIVVPLVLSVPCFALIYVILNQNVVPHELIMQPCFFLIFLLPAAIRVAVRVEFFQFYDHWQRPIFYIVREQKQQEECDDYVRALLDRIELLENDLPLPVADRIIEPISSISLPDPNGFAVLLDGELRWKASLIFGAIAAGLPWIAELSRFLDQFQFLIVFGCSIGGVLCCALSFSAKERFRYLSLVGAVLALIPPYFY